MCLFCVLPVLPVPVPLRYSPPQGLAPLLVLGVRVGLSSHTGTGIASRGLALFLTLFSLSFFFIFHLSLLS
jgi:hypothetical protein